MTTRNIVPRADGEGSLGTSVKKWGGVHTDALHAGTIATTGSISGVTEPETDESVRSASTAFVKRELAKYLPIENNAGYHNSVYRGKSLGSSVTADQYAAIAAGTFDNLFIGDYWTINNVDWRIAAFDYWLHCGDTECTTHHVVIVPDTILASCTMNKTNVTTGAYVGSDYYKGTNSNTGKSAAQTAINNAFGSAHILNHRELLTNAVTNGASSGWAWYDSTFELMNESMVYGHDVFGPSGYETGIGKGQLPLFALEPSRITNRANWWLRSVYSAAHFCHVSYYGNADFSGASSSLGVRPAFAIKS